MKSSAKKNFHIPLSEQTYSELRRLSEDTDVPATHLAREAIEHWLREQQQGSIQNEIRKFAETSAGGQFDLDSDLESASLDLITSETKRGARK